jgi:AraC-like DNA-binding protein
MQFSFSFYSSVLLIFFTHSIVYTILLIKKSLAQQHNSNFLLACFIFLGALYIFPFMAGFAGWYDEQPYRDILFYTPFQHLLLTGPIIYFYVQSLLNPGFRFTKKLALHFLPALLYLLFSIIMVVYDKLIVKEYWFLKSQMDPDFDNWYQAAGFISMLVYFGLSIRYYILYRKLIYNVTSNAADVTFNWVRNFLIAFFVLLVSWSVLACVQIFANLTYVSAWWYYLAVAVLYYYIAISGYSNAIVARHAFRPPLLPAQRQVYLLGTTNTLFADYEDVQYEEIIVETATTQADDTIDADVAGWRDKLAAIMEAEKLYEDPELSLPQVAKKLSTNVSLLSKVINKGFKVNFNDFVNQYRVNAVMTLLKEGMHKKQTLLGIAFECGFNSKATFNRAFKKQTARSPQTWIVENC